MCTHGINIGHCQKFYNNFIVSLFMVDEIILIMTWQIVTQMYKYWCASPGIILWILGKTGSEYVLSSKSGH